MLTMKDIIRDGHPTLSEKAKDVNLPLSDEDKKTVLDINRFIYSNK